MKLVEGTKHAQEVLEQLGNAQVRDMPDGGMGSIYFCLPGSSVAGSRFGKQIAEGAFIDADGMPVSVTLDVDDRGNLNELDLFKADGSPLVRYPEITDFEIVERRGEFGVPSSETPQER